MTKKKLFFLKIITTIILSGCQITASEIALTDIDAHRNYIDKKGKKVVAQEYRMLVENNPNSEYALYYLARCLLDSERSESIIMLKKAIQINSNFYYANFLLGSALIAENNQSEGLNYLERSIKIDPKKYHAFWSLGKYFLTYGIEEENPELKLETLQKAMNNFKKFEEFNGLTDMSTRGDITKEYNEILEKIKNEVKEAKDLIESFYGRYINSMYVYDIKRDGTYSFYVQELNLENLSQNEILLTNYDKLPRTEVLKGTGKWTRNGNTIKLDGPGLSSEYILKFGSLCEYNVYKNDEVCYDKQK